MMGKVKEAVFSTFTSFGLFDEGVSTRHLDIFCGSGSVGIESLSRGASHASFVDFSRDCCDTVQRNVDWCQFNEPGKTNVVCADYLQALRDPTSVGFPATQTFDIVTRGRRHRGYDRVPCRARLPASCHFQDGRRRLGWSKKSQVRSDCHCHVRRQPDGAAGSRHESARGIHFGIKNI